MHARPAPAHVPRRGTSAATRGGMRDVTQQIYCVHCQALSDVADLAAWHAALGTADLRSVPGASASALVGGIPFAICRHEPRHGRPNHRPGPACSTWNSQPWQAWLCLTTTGGHSDGLARFLYAVLAPSGHRRTYRPPGPQPAWPSSVRAPCCLFHVEHPGAEGPVSARRGPAVSRESSYDGGPSMSSASNAPPASPASGQRRSQVPSAPRRYHPCASAYARRRWPGCTRLAADRRCARRRTWASDVRRPRGHRGVPCPPGTHRHLSPAESPEGEWP